MNTIGSYQEDSSAVGRLNAWQMAWNLACDRITGGGFTIQNIVVFSRYAPNPEMSRAAHSIYFQVLGDTGFVGLFLFMSMIATALVMTIRTQRRARKRPDLAWAVGLARAIQISIVVYLVCGAALSNVYFELLYIVLAVTSRTHRTVVEMTAAQNVPARAAPQGRLVPAYGRAV